MMQATVAQMRLTIYLCLVITSPTPPGFTEILAIELKPWLASFTLPNGPVVQEKVSRYVYNHVPLMVDSYYIIWKCMREGTYKSMRIKHNGVGTILLVFNINLGYIYTCSWSTYLQCISASSLLKGGASLFVSACVYVHVCCTTGVHPMTAIGLCKFACTHTNSSCSLHALQLL